MPKISVLMPVYNGEKYLKEAIESVLRQSFHDFEFLIVNDGSTDQSKNIIKKYQKIDTRIVYLENEKNLGVQKTLNRGLASCKGDYIARIDSDDIWCDNNKLQKQVDFLEKNPGYALVGTAMETIDENGRKLQKIYFPLQDQDIRKHLILSSQFAHPSVLINTQVFNNVGPYAIKKIYRHIEDYELWLRIGKKYKFANLEDIAINYRINTNGLSIKNQFKQRLGGLILTIKYIRDYPMGIKATCIKIVTLFFSRNTLDTIITKHPFIKKMYTKLTGIKKTS